MYSLGPNGVGYGYWGCAAGIVEGMHRIMTRPDIRLIMLPDIRLDNVYSSKYINSSKNIWPNIFFQFIYKNYCSY